MGNMGSERVREIMGGHFEKYGIRSGMGNNGIGPNHLHSSLSPTKATSSTPHITGRASILHLPDRASPVSEISSRHQPTGSKPYHEKV